MGATEIQQHAVASRHEDNFEAADLGLAGNVILSQVSV